MHKKRNTRCYMHKYHAYVHMYIHTYISYNVCIYVAYVCTCTYMCMYLYTQLKLSCASHLTSSCFIGSNNWYCDIK